MREIPKVKPSMGAWEGRVGEGGPERLERERKSSRRKGEGWQEEGRGVSFPWRTEWCLCRGCVGLWHDDLGQKMKNHIARDYYTAVVSAAAAASGAGGGYAHTYLFLHISERGVSSSCRSVESLWQNNLSFRGKISGLLCVCCDIVCICCFWSGAELSRLLNRES